MNKQLFFTLTIFTLLHIPQLLYGQSSGLEVLNSFGIRADDPVIMNVTNKGDRISFNANNKSYFPYDLTIKFSSLQNLSPGIFERKVILHPGNNNLFALTIVNKDQSTTFDYSFKYSIRLANNPDLSFPYLIPIGQGKIVQLISIKDSDNEILLLNQFKMNPGDSVFAIRKGTVTALPNDNSRVDRIIKSSSLEVLHSDGTLAIYRGLDYANIKLHLGQTIYAGQPIGIIDKNGPLQLNLLSMNNSESFNNLEIYYSDQNGKIVSSKLIKDMKVVYPKEIIEKEMTSREVKRHKNDKTF